MPRSLLSMRWWLGLAFAGIAVLTALAVAQVFNHRAEAALRDRGEELAIGQSVSAASAVARAERQGVLADAVALIAERRRFSVFVFSADGTLISDPSSSGTQLSQVPGARRAVARALEGRRYVADSHGKAFIVGLRVESPPGGAIVTFTRRPELRAELGAVRDQILYAALIAVAIAAIVGLLVAGLITMRLRRIADAAAAIEGGEFDRPLRPRFHDELGALAETIDQMRERLRRSFATLADERDRLLRLLERLQEGVISVDRELGVVVANRAAERLLGTRLEPGTTLPEPWPDFPLRAFAGELLGGGGRVAEARVAADDRTFALTGIPSRGAVSEAVLVISDVSERERRERAEREFVTNAAHELGTPLTAIAAALEVLEQGAAEVPEERARFIELIGRQTTRLARLRRALLALARAQTRQETPRLEPVVLRSLLEDAAEEAERAGVAVEVDAPADLAALAHEELIEQVVFNLVGNAIKHAAPTRIRLSARLLRDGSSVAVEVADDGRGIPLPLRERLFDRFYRGEGDEGFGLGLAIVREAVRALGGTIEIEPGPDGGTTARVTLASAKVAV